MLLLFIILGIIIIILISCIYTYFKRKRDNTISIEEKYIVYKKLFDQHMYIKELAINEKAYLINRKLKSEQLDMMVYYLIVPNNNEDMTIGNIVIKYLDFIEYPDLIESENKISNYDGLINALHELTGKDEKEILKLTKREFIASIKN
jgi:hypothetical protein